MYAVSDPVNRMITVNQMGFRYFTRRHVCVCVCVHYSRLSIIDDQTNWK